MTRLPKTTLSGLIIAVSIIGIGSYSLWQMRDFLFGTPLTITTPTHGETVHTPIIAVAGTAPNIQKLTLNGEEVLTKPDGSFKEPVVLATGYNVLEVRSLNKFNREARRVFEIVYQPLN